MFNSNLKKCLKYNLVQEGEINFTSHIKSETVDISDARSWLYYFRFGNIVTIRFSFKMKNTCNGTYSDYLVCSDLPRAYCCARSGDLCVDDDDISVFVEMKTTNLKVYARHKSIADKVVIGGFIYISNLSF